MPMANHSNAKRARVSATKSGDEFQLREQVTQFFLLGSQVADIIHVRGDFKGNAGYLYPITLQAFDLVRVVGEQPDFTDPEVSQNLRANSIVAQVIFETQLQIRLHRVQPRVLQRVSANFVTEPDAATFLMQINDHARVRRENPVHRFLELLP